MGLSLSRVYQSLSSLAFWGKDKEVRILMVGLDSAGKTTILYRLQVGSLDFSDLRPVCMLTFVVDRRSGFHNTQ